MTQQKEGKDRKMKKNKRVACVNDYGAGTLRKILFIY